MSEGREIVAELIRELEALPRDGLRAAAEEGEESMIEGPSGRAYRLDMSFRPDLDDEDDFSAEVKLHGTGVRRLTRLRANAYVPDEQWPEERWAWPGEPGRITNRTQDILAAAGTFAIFAALIAPWFIGVGFLISLLF